MCIRDRVGLAALGPSDDPDLAESGAVELLVLGVDPDHRRVGHGSRLLAAAAQFGAERGGALLTTWVLVNHEATRAFLQGAGFGPDRARRERVVSPEAVSYTHLDVYKRQRLAIRDRAAMGSPCDPVHTLSLIHI